MTYFLKEDYEIYDSLPCSAVVFSVDDNYKIYYTNDTYNNENFNQDNIIVEEECRKLFDDTIRSADTPKRLYFKSKNLSGDSIYICMFAVKLDDKHIFALLFDDSENKKKFMELENQCSKYIIALSATNEYFFEYDSQKDTNTIFYMSSIDNEMLERPVQNFMKNLDNNAYMFQEDTILLKSLKGRPVKDELTIDARMRMNDSEPFEWYRLVLKPSEKTNTYIGCARNINETKKKEEQLNLKARIDPLSKVLNRETAIEKIRERLKTQTMNEECAFIVLDIDNFKNINDTFGHLYGDAVIAMVAGSIKSTLDSEDIIGRFGGDEFLVYIDNTKPEKLERKLENIRLAILKMRIDKNDEKDISCSMGVALGRGGVKYEDLFRQADSALYMAKTNGKNRFEYFNGEFIDKNALMYAGIMTKEDESEEVSENHDIIMVALEIASKSTDSDNAISNLMRHIGVAINLDCIQIMKYDMINDKVEIEFQWWKEHDGDYNVVFTDKKSGYYEHNDLVLFKKRFQKDNIFKYTPAFKEEFTQKYRNIFEAAEHVQMIYSSNTENEDVYYVVCYQCWDKQRIWEKKEFDDMFEITKILSMFMKSSHIITEREKFLQNKVDNDDYGVFTLSKFEEEVGRITRNAHVTNKKIGFVYFNFNRFYEFNRIYGREEGDRVLKQFAKFLLVSSEEVCVNCHLNGTDKFISCFMFEEGVDLETKIQQKLEAFSDTVGNYKECPVVITAGVATINPGENVTEALDLANHTLKGANAEKSICIMAKE